VPPETPERLPNATDKPSARARLHGAGCASEALTGPAFAAGPVSLPDGFALKAHRSFMDESTTGENCNNPRAQDTLSARIHNDLGCGTFCAERIAAGAAVLGHLPHGHFPITDPSAAPAASSSAATSAATPAPGVDAWAGGSSLGHGAGETRWSAAPWRLLAAAALAGLRVPVAVSPWQHLEGDR
jgi:hypothetical protein